jgi:hypothetical protein
MPRSNRSGARRRHCTGWQIISWHGNTDANSGISEGTANSEGQQGGKGTVGQDDLASLALSALLAFRFCPPKILFVMAHSLWHFPALSKHSESWHTQ